jgi:hypothetical protein
VADHTDVAEEQYMLRGDSMGAVTVDGGHNWNWFNLSNLPDGLVAGASLTRSVFGARLGWCIREAYFSGNLTGGWG